MSKSPIQWTEQTWNPTRGCSVISPGCVSCYARRMAARNLPGMKSPTTGLPFAIYTPSGPQWTGEVELIPSMLDIPLRRRQPTTYFVDSMSDLFHEKMPFSDIDRVFTAMVMAPQHTYQILTKRDLRLLEYVRSGRHNNGNGPDRADYHRYENIWLGVSVEDRQRKSRIDTLRQVPADVRFLSIEPLLEDIGVLNLDGIDWVIVGGESGPDARPFDLEWARSIIRQCQEQGVACFVKQLGSNPINPLHEMGVGRTANRKGGDMEEWPADLRVRQMPVKR